MGTDGLQYLQDNPDLSEQVLSSTAWLWVQRCHLLTSIMSFTEFSKQAYTSAAYNKNESVKACHVSMRKVDDWSVLCQ